MPLCCWIPGHAGLTTCVLCALYICIQEDHPVNITPIFHDHTVEDMYHSLVVEKILSRLIQTFLFFPLDFSDVLLLLD